MNYENRFIVGLNEMDTVVDFLRQQLSFCRIFAFYGPLGAGKTTLVKRLFKRLGITDTITSPTFTYLNCYKNKQGQTFYHFDCYRLESLNDFLSAGFGEYLSEGQSWSFIEWPEIIDPILKDKVCKVKIDYHKNPEKRIIRCEIIK